MDLTLSKRGDYVVRAALALADAWDGRGAFRTIDDVAREMDLPRSFTPQVLADLSHAGVAESKSGRGGGYRLSRAPSKVSMLEVVEAAEGRLVSQRCPIRGGPCRWDDVCAVHPTWLKASDAVRAALGRTTLAQVAAVDRDLAGGVSKIPAAPASHRRPRTP